MSAGAKLRVVDGYVRVSRVGDRDDLTSDRLQAESIQRETTSLGLELGEVFVDLDQSGGKEDRPGLSRALARVEAGASSGIMVTRLDRFSRDIGQALRLAERLERAGGSLYVIEEAADLKTPDGAFMVQVRLAVATHQRNISRQYLDKSKADAIARGVPVNPRLPPGVVSVLDGRGKRIGIEVEETKAVVVRELFARRVAGAGPTELAQLLEDAGIETSMGAKAWSKQAVYGLLRNRIYLGEIRQGEHVNPSALPPIVDRATWEAAQSGRSAARPGRRVVADTTYLLTGLARCASCGYAMQATRHSRGDRLYRCTVKHSSGRCPEPARIKADEAERLALAELRALAASTGPRAEVDDRGEALALLERSLSEAEAERDRWATDLEVREAFGEPAWLAGARERRDRAAQAASAVAAARAVLPVGPDIRLLADELDEMDAEDLRGALVASLDCIAIRSRRHDDRVHLFLRGAAPADLPRRGFNARPTLRPFALPGD